MKLLIINGPNINFLGIREPAIYGSTTYKDLCGILETWCADAGASCELFQSNHEGAIVDRIQQAWFDGVDGIVMNPAAYTHTSVAILDALKATAIPTVEAHISDVSTREAFRHHLRRVARCEAHDHRPRHRRLPGGHRMACKRT